MDLINKKILVTGGAGFLGQHLVAILKKDGIPPSNIFIPRSEVNDLRKLETCQDVVKGKDIVIHLAANVGGIGYNRDNPGTLFYDNILMGVQLIEEARKAGIEKFVAIGTVCAYPKLTPVPFKEENLWDGYPEETNAPYGLAKKMLLVQSQAYRDQYGFNSIYLLPVNMYGPGDNFDPKSSHVIPALIRKFVSALSNNKKQVVVWGSGYPTREFLYVEDAAEAILLATKRYNKPEPINVGAGFEISIRVLAEMIGKIVGFKGDIVFDRRKPDGQPRRMLDVTRAEREFGFKAKTNFNKGLKMTIAWYLKNVK
ncbi:GDP-fucose synthetase [Candidatus Woesebacteria bacterium RIFCSPHIGHO2_02_FULL_38_9]|nr:MAG: GDP-fucose synthetase [Candidatus Woesebacteria bacterium RIFCSPHIGHO2_02_FULL_38_9]OGM57301.1 MAG: GDP-fucose synthetase [Candidatus Woesebacteria bacterium RIFCSPLOWO2_01_FULL_38_20]